MDPERGRRKECMWYFLQLGVGDTRFRRREVLCPEGLRGGGGVLPVASLVLSPCEENTIGSVSRVPNKI